MLKIRNKYVLNFRLVLHARLYNFHHKHIIHHQTILYNLTVFYWDVKKYFLWILSYFILCYNALIGPRVTWEYRAIIIIGKFKLYWWKCSIRHCCGPWACFFKPCCQEVFRIFFKIFHNEHSINMFLYVVLNITKPKTIMITISQIKFHCIFEYIFYKKQSTRNHFV